MSHVFETSGLGLAPFRCVGLFSLPSTSLAAANPEAYNNAMRDIPRGLSAGSCNYCGTSILHHFIIESSDDKRFVVGSDCVAKTGDAGLIKQVRRERLRIALEARTAKRNASRAERQAAWDAERAERGAVFAAEHAALIDRAQVFEDNRFLSDVTSRALAGGFISDRCFAAWVSAIESSEAAVRRRAASRHVGTVGKREVFDVTVERINYFDRPRFGGYGNETVWVVTLRTDADATIVVKSTAFHPEKGARLSIKATVKEHSEYRGERQTIVQRVAIVGEAVAA